MAYNLPLQLVIQPPTQGQLNSVRKSVESALSGINVGSVDAKNFAKTNAAIQQTGKQFEQTGQKAEKFWDTVEGKTRSAIAYTAISTALMKVTGAVSQATREAMKYEAELLKISQVTGDSVQLTKDYSKSLVDISKKYNVTLSKVAQLTRTLNQTGLSFKEAAKGAEVLARTSLLATFDSLTSTTEGLIAVMQTFEFTVTRAGKVLESINSVSKAFAVESTDIVEAIRRTGGAFSTAGGSIEELIALFTAVRSTSRESAETIATGFRTIFGRLQRPKTIEYFKQLGIQLETAEGQFIGPYQAIEQISKGLENLGIVAGTTKFAEVVEQIGGIRQISRVVPLLEQAAKSQKALDIANSGTVDSIKDVEKAQQGLGYQLGALQKEFGALISDIVNSPSFKFLAEVFINTSKAVLRLVGALKPLLPILASVAAFKIGRGLSKLLSGGFSLKGAKESLGFATGGMVPGSGNGDTVPAMLTPGEFVIRKSAVQAFGADRLASINKYALGGPVTRSGKELKGLYPSLSDKINDGDIFTANVNAVELKARKGKGSKFNKKTEQVIAGMVESGKKMMWQRFEDGISKAFNVQLVDGNSYLDYPAEPGDAKFIPADATYERYDDKKGNTNETFLAKLVGSGLYKKNATVTSYYPEDPAQIAAIVKSYKQGTVPKFKDGGMEDSLKDLDLYTHSSSSLNRYVSGRDPGKGRDLKKLEKMKTSLDSLMQDALPSMLFSGIKENRFRTMLGPDWVFGPEEWIGKNFTLPGFISTSDNKSVAETFARHALLNIKTSGKKGINVGLRLGGTGVDTSGMDIDALQKLGNTLPGRKSPYGEGEYILPRDSKFKIVSAEDTNMKKPYMYDIAVQQFANGGGVGTDTVPALLTPGEFVINKKSAQSFGYDKLHEINKYADGGFVDGLEVQKFHKGGLSKAEKKRLRREKEARDSGSVLTKGEQTGGVFKGIIAKYEKLYKEEKTQLQEYYQQKANNAIKEGKSVKAVLDEYNAAVADLKKGIQTAGRKEISDKKVDIIKKLTDALKPAQVETKTFADKIKASSQSLVKSVSKMNISFAEMEFGAQSLVSGLKNFAGVNINQEALTQAQVKSTAISGIGESVASIGNRKNAFMAGKALEKFGKMVPGVGGKLSKFGTTIAKNAGTISKAAKGIAKGVNVIAGLELFGGIIDSILSKDYGKQRDQFIELGDAAGAASAASKAYAQETLRGIPVIGSLIAGFASYFDILPTGIDANQKLATSNAFLAASTKGLAKKLEASQKDFVVASKSGDAAGQKAAIKNQLSAINDVKLAAANVKKNIDVINNKGFDFGKILLSGAGYAAEGAAIGGTVGAGVGGVVGGVAGSAAGGVGAVPGAIAGAASGSKIGTGIGAGVGFLYGVSVETYNQITTSTEQIVKGFEYISESIKTTAEAQANVMGSFGDALNSQISKVIRAGGSYEDALKTVTEKFGGPDVVKELFGGQDLASVDPKTLREKSKAYTQEIEAIKRSSLELSSYWDEREIAENEARIAELEGKQIILDKTIEVRVASQAAAEQEKRLAKERAIAAKAISEEIRLRKEFQQVVDSSNQSLRNLNNIASEISNIGTGKLTFRQAAQKTNLGVDPKILEMSTEEILRNTSALSQMGSSVEKFAGAGAGAVVKKLQANFDRLSEISSEGFLNKIDLKTFDQGEGTASEAQQIQERILSNLNGYVKGSDAIFENAVLNFAKDIQSGIENAGSAEQKAREEVSKLASDFIEKNKEQLTEVAKKEQEYRELEIELIQKRMQYASDVYDMEADMFSKRMSLNNQIDDLLNPIQEGPGKATAIANRGRDRAAIERSGMLARREKAFAQPDVGMAGQTLDQAVQSFVQNMQNVGDNFAKFKGQSDILLKTINDEVRIEQDRLDSLISSAQAQQEYTQALRDAQGSIVRDLVTGTDEEVGQIFQTMNATAVAAQQGNFVGIPENMKKDVFNLLDQFANVEIPGLGKKGRDIQREISKNEMMRRFGVDEKKAGELADAQIGARVPIGEQMTSAINNQKAVMEELYKKEETIKLSLLQNEANNINQFKLGVDAFRDGVDTMIFNLKNGNVKDALPIPGVGQIPANQPFGQNATVEPAKTYGLSPSVQKYAEGLMNAKQERKDLLAKKQAGTITEEEKQRLSRTTFGIASNNTRLADAGYGGKNGKLHPNVQNYINELERVKSEQGMAGNVQGFFGNIPVASSTGGTIPSQPNTGVPMPQSVVSATPDNQQSPVQVQTQGQQEITIRLPDIQAMVNQAITATVMDSVSQQFSQIAEDVRSAQNFADVGNIFASASENVSNKEIQS